jgi:hypothetical protein
MGGSLHHRTAATRRPQTDLHASGISAETIAVSHDNTCRPAGEVPDGFPRVTEEAAPLVAELMICAGRRSHIFTQRHLGYDFLRRQSDRSWICVDH